jgi:hypothetical protein
MLVSLTPGHRFRRGCSFLLGFQESCGTVISALAQLFCLGCVRACEFTE